MYINHIVFVRWLFFIISYTSQLTMKKLVSALRKGGIALGIHSGQLLTIVYDEIWTVTTENFL